MPDRPEKTPKQPRKNAATLIVEIAEKIWDFSAVAEQRGGTSSFAGDDPVAVYCFATLRADPHTRRPLEDIRPDLAMEYQFRARHDPVGWPARRCDVRPDRQGTQEPRGRRQHE